MEFSLAVLNPGGRDQTRIFAQGAGCPADPGHPPVNYHGYAACCRGAFYRRSGQIPGSVEGVLVLLRKSGLGDALQAVRSLRELGKRVLVSWKESGLPARLTSSHCIDRRVVFAVTLFRPHILLRRQSGISRSRSPKESVFLLARASSPLPREITF